MLIDTQMRLRSIERALRDVILPAIDPSRATAIEQAGYILQHLELMAHHVDWEYAFDLAELKDYRTLAAGLAEALGGEGPAELRAEADRALAASAPFCEMRLLPLSEVKAQIACLRGVADHLLEATMEVGGAAKAAAARAVMDAAAVRETREAVWAQGKGYADTGGEIDVSAFA